MIISNYDAAALASAFGIGASAIDGLGVGAGWARVGVGRTSEPHQHDETETFVIVRGSGAVITDGRRYPVSSGTVVQFEPFETHRIENTGTGELAFANLYWRDPVRAAGAAGAPGRRRFAERPVFVYSTPPTPNGDLHLGHLCGPYLGADAFVRFQRMNGTAAWHITGTDDHQSYVAARARREGRELAWAAEHFHAEIAATLRLMDIVPDQFTGTSAAPGYQDGVQAFFSRIASADLVTPRERPALFADGSGDYLFEVDVSGGCPGCGAEASGNICEECGEPNSCVDLTEPWAAGSGTTLRAGTLTSFCVPLHEMRAALEAHHRLGRVPARIRDVAARVLDRPRLDVAITHPVPWGTRPAETDAPGQRMWAIIDVAYSLLYGVESLGRRLGRDWRADSPEPDWKIVQFFGFDNTFYNAIFVPALYALAYPGWQPDVDYNVNEFYGLEGSKFSTSRNHVIWGKDILGPHSVDALRLFLAWTRPEGRRTDFERAAYEALLRETLLGEWQGWLTDLGERVERRYGGAAPDAGIWTPEHTAFLARLERRSAALAASLGPDAFSLNHAADELLGLAADAVRFARAESPAAQAAAWQDEARTAVALELAAARLLAACAAPLMPRFAARLADAVGVPGPGPPGSGPLAELTAGPGALPLFVIHPVGGTVFNYALLARELAGAYRVYGVQAPGLADGVVAATSLAALAGEYAAAIRSAQPRGPYRLAGWSMGGVLAYEIARLLEGAGEDVALLALLDASSALPDERGVPERELAARFVADACATLGWVGDEAPRGLPESADGQLAWLAARLAGGPGDISVRAQLDRRYAVFRAHSQLITGYRPQPGVRAAALLVSTQESAGQAAGWRPALAGEVRCLPLPGGHYGLLGPAGSREIADAILALADDKSAV